MRGVNQYLVGQYEALRLGKEVESIVTSRLLAAKLTVLDKFGTNRLRLGKRRKIVKKCQEVEKSLFQKQVNKAFLRQKKIEFKIQKEKRRIQENSQVSHTPKLTKEELKILQQERIQKCQQFSKIKQREQKERLKRIEKQRIDRQKMVKLQIQLQKQQKIEKQFQISRQQKQERIQKLKEKSQIRKQEALQLKKFAIQIPKLKPLYKRLQQLTPEPSTLKPNPIKQGVSPNIQEHFQKYKQWKQEIKSSKALHKKQSSLSPVPSYRIRNIIEIQRQQNDRSLQSLREKQQLIRKRKQYASSVRKLHPPIPDPLKQKQMQIIKQRLDRPSKAKVYPNTPNSLKHTQNKASNTRSAKAFRSIKKLPPPQVPAIPANKSSEYLNKRREIRKKLQGELLKKTSQPAQQDFKSIALYSKHLQQKATRGEGLLKYRNSGNPFDFQSINAEDEINKFIIDSIKSKLTMVE